jgi:GDP-4-dehydro-6-deoxy-D-mannose reductase
VNILVTGAAGFLGRALVARLKLRPELTLHLCDRQSAPGGVFHHCDFLDGAAVARLVQETLPDQIFHLAGTLTNEYAKDFPANVETTRHLLESVRQGGRPVRVLLIGSAGEYGCVRAQDNPLREDHPLAPVSLYGWTKACQTMLMDYYHSVHSLDLVMARLFNLSGAGASNQLFVGRVEEQVKRLLAGEAQEITVGNLEAQRDYLPVAEAARQLERVMQFGQSGQVYHVASGVPTRMKDLLDELLRAQGLSHECVRQAPRPLANKLDVPVIYADVSKTSRLPQLP